MARFLPRILLLALFAAVVPTATAARAAISPTRADVPYGDDAAQRMDLYLPADAATRPAAGRPAVVFVHGGGWHRGSRAVGGAVAGPFVDRGLAFVSVDYRLAPAATWQQQAQDVAAAVGWVRDHAGELGIDAGRISLMGHSSGAHVAACVAAQPTWLAAVGLHPRDLDAAVLLDGAAYDVAAQVRQSRGRFRELYTGVFGQDAAKWREASPALTAAAGDVARRWALLYAGNRAASRERGKQMADAAEKAGAAKVVLIHAPDDDHAAALHTLGDPADPEGRQILDLLTAPPPHTTRPAE